MSIDSTAELLFKVSADTQDAQNNIARFRNLLGKNIDDLGAEFGAWSNKVFGDLSTVQGALNAVAAAALAGGVAIAAGLVAAAEKAADYAVAIGRASALTGIGAEQMSGLRYAADVSGLSFDSLTQGLVKFARSVDMARDPTSQQALAFHRMGISQDAVNQGGKALLPLFYATADAFAKDMTVTERAAVSRQLFSKGGADLILMLSKGSDKLKEFAAEAQQMGLVITTEGVASAKAYKAEIGLVKDTLEGLTIDIGAKVLPMINELAYTFVGTAAAVKAWVDNLTTGVYSWEHISQAYVDAITDYQVRIHKLVEAAKTDNAGLLPEPAKMAEAKANFTGLSNILESINGKIASETSAYAKLNQEIDHYAFEAQKAAEELKKLQSAGKITQESYTREMAALAEIPAQMVLARRQGLQKLDAVDLEHNLKQMEALDQVHTELADKLAVYDSQDYTAQRAKLDKESDQLRQSSEKKAQLTVNEYALLDQIHQAGLNKIARDQTQAFLTEIEKLQQNVEQMVLANLVGADKLNFQYQQDLRNFSQVEEAKALKTAQSEAERATIHAFYEQANKQLLQTHAQDLQQLLNSQGWRGVFGDHFASQIKGNEALMKEWASSSNQSLLMVNVTMEALKKLLIDTFTQFAQGMAQNIAHALIYEQSVGKAMRGAAAAAMESMAAEALVHSIMAMGLGFYDLAIGNFSGAGTAFAAAAIWGSVGGVAAITGRAIAPKDASSTSASASGASSSSSTSADSASASSSSAQAQPSVYIHVNGSIIGPSGASELCDIINQAVYGNDVTLYASHTKAGVPIG